ncbi:hypothetical protein BSKO_07688 [Bryopsis sp. KO-2023]|nr:hypothetical protein BSKO_07688 [Bryopsis sp. KO-2023]
MRGQKFRSVFIFVPVAFVVLGLSTYWKVGRVDSVGRGPTSVSGRWRAAAENLVESPPLLNQGENGTQHEVESSSLVLELPHDTLFHTYRMQSLGVSICGSDENLDTPCGDACGSVTRLINHLSNHDSDTHMPELYIVPLDGIALLRSSNFSLYEEVLEMALDSVYNGYSFMRLGGATHALLCLVDGCEHVMMDVVKSHPMGKRSRVLWVGSKEHRPGKRLWACPDRVVLLPESLIQALGLRGTAGCEMDSNLLWMGVHGLLQAVRPLIMGKDRWACGRQKWNLDLQNTSLSADLIVDRKHKMLYCAIPKCGNTRVKVLLRRMTGQRDWDIIDYEHLYGKKAHFEVVNKKADLIKYFEDPSWIKTTFVRHPAERFLSGYLNKVVYTKWYKVLNEKQKTKPSISKVISDLMKISKTKEFNEINGHFRRMTSFCGFEHVRYDFIGRTPNMNYDMKELLSSMGVWEKYGASGWGKNKSMSFQTASVYKAPNHSGSIIRENLTDGMLRKLFKIFHKDYEMLDFEEMDVGDHHKIERR